MNIPYPSDYLFERDPLRRCRSFNSSDLFDSYPYQDKVSIDSISVSATDKLETKQLSLIYKIYNWLKSLARSIICPGAKNGNRTFRLQTEITFFDYPRYKESRLGYTLLKKFRIDVNDFSLDSMTLGSKGTKEGKRWVLFSLGNGELFEDRVVNQNELVCQFLKETNANGLFFNYPGYGKSTGAPTKENLTTAYKAMLHVLENHFGAKEIVCYGMSLGGGIQGEALKTHELKKNVKYVFVKDRTFSSIRDVAASIFYPLGSLVSFLDWNIGSVESSKKLQAPEIILQTADVKKATILQNSSSLTYNDGVITKSASLAKALLDSKTTKNKTFIGIPGKHNDPIQDSSLLTKSINIALNN